jgi:hypothetical protein
VGRWAAGRRCGRERMGGTRAAGLALLRNHNNHRPTGARVSAQRGAETQVGGGWRATELAWQSGSAAVEGPGWALGGAAHGANGLHGNRAQRGVFNSYAKKGTLVSHLAAVTCHGAARSSRSRPEHAVSPRRYSPRWARWGCRSGCTSGVSSSGTGRGAARRVQALSRTRARTHARAGRERQLT